MSNVRSLTPAKKSGTSILQPNTARAPDEYLPLIVAINLVEAAAYATTLKHPKQQEAPLRWVSITICKRKLLKPKGYFKDFCDKLVERTRHWYGHLGYYLWVREEEPTLGEHIHLLLGVPDGQSGTTVKTALFKLFKTEDFSGDVLTEGGRIRTDAVKAETTTPLDWAAYCAKVHPSDAERLHQETDVRQNPEGMKPAGHIIGKRYGIARQLDQKARKAAQNSAVPSTINDPADNLPIRITEVAA